MYVYIDTIPLQQFNEDDACKRRFFFFGLFVDFFLILPFSIFRFCVRSWIMYNSRNCHKTLKVAVIITSSLSFSKCSLFLLLCCWFWTIAATTTTRKTLLCTIIYKKAKKKNKRHTDGQKEKNVIHVSQLIVWYFCNF